MKPIDILLRQNRFVQQPFVHLFRQRCLNQDAVDVLARIQLRNNRQQLLCRYRVGRCNQLAEEAEFLAGFYFAAHINLRCGHAAHQHSGQTGTNALRGKLPHGKGDFGLNRFGNLRSVENCG